MKIIIKEKFKEDFTTREAGERLRKMISSSASEIIMLDFSQLKIASASFFDEGIAKLYSEENWSEKKLQTTLKFLNLFPKDDELLKKVCAVRGFIIHLN